MNKVEIVKIHVVKERNAYYETAVITNPGIIADIFSSFLEGADREHFVVACLNNKNKVNALHTVSIGSINTAIVHPREVFKLAILANAASIIVGHNHPSGDTKPSQEDLDTTKRLVEAGEVLGIPVLDHIIVGDHTFLSLKERGLL